VKTLRALLARLRGLPRPSPRQWQGLGATLVTLAVLFWWAGEGPQEDPSAAPASGPAPEQVPDFSALPTVSARKAAFFAFLLPRIEAENQRIDELRARIEVLQSADGPWDGAAEAWLTDLETRYGLPSPGDGADRLPRLLRRVDRIPPSLALAQAATESAWVPLLRPEGSEHEVRLFEHSADSVVSYMHNLNSHPAHRSFRVLRAAARREGRSLSGELLAPGLLRYSERRAAYVADLLAIMRFNRLGRFDS
jgi:Bax protein